METPRYPLESAIEAGGRRVFLKLPQGVVELYSGIELEAGESIFIFGKTYLVTAKGCGEKDINGKPFPHEVVFAFDKETGPEAVRATIAAGFGYSSINHDHFSPDPTPSISKDLNPLIRGDVTSKTLARMGLGKKMAA
jgi:hypothetical protein